MRKTVTRARRGGGAVASGGPMIHWIAKDVSRPCVAREISLSLSVAGRAAGARHDFASPIVSSRRWLVLFSRSFRDRDVYQVRGRVHGRRLRV